MASSVSDALMPEMRITCGIGLNILGRSLRLLNVSAAARSSGYRRVGLEAFLRRKFSRAQQRWYPTVASFLTAAVLGSHGLRGLGHPD